MKTWWNSFLRISRYLYPCFSQSLSPGLSLQPDPSQRIGYRLQPRHDWGLAPDVACVAKGKDEIAELSSQMSITLCQPADKYGRLKVGNEKVAESEREKAEFLFVCDLPWAGRRHTTSMMGMIDYIIYVAGGIHDRDTTFMEMRNLEEQSALVQSILARPPKWRWEQRWLRKSFHWSRF